jgi:serine phosphatase RsbU (regulator of sigma subunit)
VRRVERQQEYLRRLADIDARVARARLEPAVLVDRAAGLLAGRVGSRVDEAHAYLLDRASQQGRTVELVAEELLAALEGRAPAGPERFDSAVDQAFRPPHRPARRRRAQPPRLTEPVSEEWARAAQEILSGLPDNHTVVLPVRGDNGDIVDYVFAAASPSMVDTSGRRGEQIVGRRVSEAYPTVVDSPVWAAWRQVLDDGEPRQVGPFPYLGATERSPAEMTITVRVQPAGPGLLNSWVRHDEQNRLAERIAQTERLGNLGWGEADLVSGETVWSDGLYRIYERDPALGPLPGAEQDALTLPEDEPIRRQAAAGFGRGETVDMTVRIRLGDRVKHLRSVIDAVRDVHGRPLKVYGIVQDVTAQEISRARLAEVERQLREHRQTLAAEHELAAQLQQIVLPVPAEPFDLSGLRVAVRYLPAEEASRVGGDWFHAAGAEDGSVILAVGDVAGHGMQAATTMAQLRQMLAGLTVTTTTEPADLLAHLNRLLYAGSMTATAVVARYDPGTCTVEWAQAGHPAPLHSRVGSTSQLIRPKGPLLGALRPARYATATLTLDPGDLLMFYTDGLIEHRSHTAAEGLAPVIATLNRITASGSRQPLADLLAQLRRANPEDDTCILAVRRLGPEASGGDHA